MVPLDRKNRRQALAILLVRLLVLPLSDDGLREYGLGRPLGLFIAGNDGGDRQARIWLEELCSAAGLGCEIWSAETATGGLVQLFDNQLICSFLLIHDDGGTRWFNKERFEELLVWLALQAAFEHVQDEQVPLVPVAELKALAAAAGYRVRTFLKLAAELEEGGA